MSILNDDCNFIINMINNGTYTISGHAIKRMNERSINEYDIENTVINGAFSYANFDKSKGEAPRYMFSDKNANVIIALTDENVPVVVTVY